MQRIYVTSFIALLTFLLLIPNHLSAQFFDKLKKELEKEIVKEAEKPTDEEKSKEKKSETDSDESSAEEKGNEPELKWSKYDFVPGDQVIFEDDQLLEENGEFPSRWDLKAGNVEVAEYGEDMVIMMRDGHPSIVPFFQEPQKDYLPEIFTIEFDLYYPGSGTFETHLYDRKNQKSGSPTGYTSIDIYHNEMRLGQFKSRLPDENVEKSRWMHIAIAYTKGKLKAYMDETRLLNIPRIDFDPKGLTLYTYHANNENLYYVKNIRIAKGGVKYYDRIMEDGKIIANGIRFDVNKATLKPESMGIINKIYKLLEKYPELKFSVEGHTDSDGEDASNQTLSEERAKTVMNKLVSMGISANRLSSKGFGETKPIDNNNTAEGKANNRRVEFVKI
ncbi:MAG: OmpA family protein [Bacteroidota bacterium]